LQSLLWQWLVLALMGGILLMGVSRGIEAVTKRLMPLLFILLLVIGVRSLTLPGASEGLHFLFSPDFSKVTAGVVLTAMGLAFFKLSIGMGCMMTYGSYFRDDQHLPLTTVRVMCADLFVSMLAGIAIFPAVFAFGFEPSAGPSLLFITIPAVFASIPFGHLFMVLFFVLSAIAATGAMLSILEVPVSVLSERFHMSRTRATLINLLVLGAVGSTCALSSSTLADVQVGGKTFFDLFDFVSSNVLMPLGGIFLCLFVGWVWGFERMTTALTNGGKLALPILSPLFFIIRYVSPLLILVVMLKGLGLF
jgi:NSS family neurotransmitter:Na+ symporter